MRYPCMVILYTGHTCARTAPKCIAPGARVPPISTSFSSPGPRVCTSEVTSSLCVAFVGRPAWRSAASEGEALCPVVGRFVRS